MVVERRQGCGCVDKSKEEDEEEDWMIVERGRVVDVWINPKRRIRRGTGWL